MPAKRCTHRFVDDHTCGSPALRGESFCYYHHPSRRPTTNHYERLSRRGFTLLAPQDLTELQIAVSIVTERLAANQIDCARAKVLLSALQLASRYLY